MKHRYQNIDQLDVYNSWIERLALLVVEFESGDEPVLSEHAESLIGELEFKKIEFVQNHGPIVTRHENGRRA